MLAREMMHAFEARAARDDVVPARSATVSGRAAPAPVPTDSYFEFLMRARPVRRRRPRAATVAIR